MNKIKSLLIILSLVTTSHSFAALQCPPGYNVGKTCQRTGKPVPRYHAPTEIAANEVLLCVGPKTPQYVMVSDKALDPKLSTVLAGVDDNMFGKNGFGVFKDIQNKNLKTGVMLVPFNGSIWHIMKSEEGKDGPPEAASELNCQ